MVNFISVLKDYFNFSNRFRLHDQYSFNFDIIRLLLSIAVLYGHIYAPISFLDGNVAVLMFFCISGFLITESYKNSKSLESYFIKRIKRIYPPIILVCIMLLVVSFIFDQTDAFKISILQLLVFKENPVGGVYTHGAFWTLIVEFQFYLLLPLFFIAVKKRWQFITLIALYILGVIIRKEFINMNNPELINHIRNMIFVSLNFFIAGIITNLYILPKIKNNHKLQYIFFGICFIMYILNPYRYGDLSIYIIAFIYLGFVLFIAKVSVLIFGKKAPWGDLSYGIYIYHFPLMTVAWIMGIGKGFYQTNNPRIIITLTILLALLSWHFIEKRICKIHKNNNV